MITVVGSNGFIGKSLCSHLISRRFIVFQISSWEQLKKELETTNSRIYSSDSVIWAAGKANPYIAEKNEEIVEEELSRWHVFLTYMSAYSNCQVVFLSSGGAIYSGNSGFYSEGDEAEGINRYGAMKRQMENRILETYKRSLVLRPSNVVGSSERLSIGQGVINHWAQKIARSESIEIFGSLDIARDFLSIKDFVSFFTICNFGNMSGIYNLGSGIGVTMKEVLDIFRTISSTPFRVIYQQARGFDRKSYVLDIKKITSETAWSPSVNLREMILEVLNHQKKSFHVSN